MRRRSLFLLLLAVPALAGAALMTHASRGGGEASPVTSDRLTSVSTKPVAIESGYERRQRFVGRVEFAQGSDLSFEIGGRVARVVVDEGERVEVGDPLAALDTARLEAHRDELAAARDESRALLELARLRDARAQELVDEDVISPQQADDARLSATAAQAALARTEAQIARIEVDLAKSVLRAPFSGEITGRHVDAGVVLDAGQAVLRLIETQRPEIRVGVSAAAASRLGAGDTVEVTIDGATRDATVLAVLSERSAATRTVPVRLALDAGTGAPLRDGELAELTIRQRVAAEGFWLPRGALTEGSRGLWVVYVAESHDGDAHRLARRPVEVLYESGDDVFVRGAIREAEPVVSHGVHRLVAGQRVTLAPTRIARWDGAQ